MSQTDRQTDGRTDGLTSGTTYDNNTVLALRASRGKNVVLPIIRFHSVATAVVRFVETEPNFGCSLHASRGNIARRWNTTVR